MTEVRFTPSSFRSVGAILEPNGLRIADNKRIAFTTDEIKAMLNAVASDAQDKVNAFRKKEANLPPVYPRIFLKSPGTFPYFRDNPNIVGVVFPAEPNNIYINWTHRTIREARDPKQLSKLFVHEIFHVGTLENASAIQKAGKEANFKHTFPNGITGWAAVVEGFTQEMADRLDGSTAAVSKDYDMVRDFAKKYIEKFGLKEVVKAFLYGDQNAIQKMLRAANDLIEKTVLDDSTKLTAVAGLLTKSPSSTATRTYVEYLKLAYSLISQNAKVPDSARALVDAVKLLPEAKYISILEAKASELIPLINKVLMKATPVK